MIRIDEIYTNTFWPWLNQHQPGLRMFYCDPFGHTEREHLFNLGSTSVNDKGYIYFHDQEPIWLDFHGPLLDDVVRRNQDIAHISEQHVVVSERGQFVDKMCEHYGWQPHYYFFHGWACLDWFRGYDKTFLIDRARNRQPKKTFMSPNRIIGGRRDHRVLFLYNIFKHGLSHNHISAPKICSQENVDIVTIAQKYFNTYPDINQVLSQVQLPRLFVGEETQKMSSCWLSNFAEVQDSLIYVPTETVYFGKRTHLTEKTFKAIALEMPFVLVAPKGSLEYLRQYGFKTFAHVLDESYDQEDNDIVRIEKVTKLLQDIDNLSPKEKIKIHQACLPAVEHNFNHFYHGGFGQILWAELNHMLENIGV